MPGPGALGSDPDQLIALAQMCQTNSDAVRSAQGRLNAMVHNAPWRGTKADEFRSAWDSRYSGWLLSVAAFFTSAQRSLEADAKAQIAASDAGTTKAGAAVAAGIASIARASQGTARPHPAKPSWWDRGIQVFDQTVHAGESIVRSDLHAAYVEEHRIVESRAFRDVVSVAAHASSLLSVIAPILGPIPIVGEVALATTVAVSAVALAGNVAEMANGVEPWSAGTLVSEGLSVAAPVAELATAGRDVVETAAAIQDATGASDGAATAGALALNLVRPAETAYRMGSGAYQAGVDVAEHHYVAAVGQVVQVGGSVAGVVGDSPSLAVVTHVIGNEIKAVPDALSANVSGVAGQVLQ